MESKEIIYEELKKVSQEEWILFIGKTTLKHEIYMIIDSSQKVPFFLWNKKSGIRMDKGDYLLHSINQYNLQSDDIIDLMEFLNNKNQYNITNFQYMLIVWNYFNKNKIDENIEIPDYEGLPPYSPIYTDFWGTHYKT